ncbi:hypothetical protein AB1L88_25330 [Tautonia sp. JC769]|uniref:hypothetical protein n=1 Tax=Tautonia sp. JC769 TaxID=3232135 RepID=UPI00345927A2
MQGRHQSCDRRRVGVWAIIVPLVVLACDRVRAQEDPRAVAPANRGPVILAADRIATWDEGATRWVRLVGRAAIFQGASGQRSNHAVVRIESVPDPLGERYRVQVYAQGHPDQNPSATPATQPPRRFALETETVQIREPFTGVPIFPLAQIPAGDAFFLRAHSELAPAPAPADPGVLATRYEGVDVPVIETPPVVPPSSEPDEQIQPVTLFQIRPEAGPDDPSPAPRRSPSVIEIPPPPPGPSDDSPFRDPSATQFLQGDSVEPDFPEATLPEMPLLPEIDIDLGGSAEIPEILPLPDDELEDEARPGGGNGNPIAIMPLAPGSQRVVNIYPLNPSLTKFRRLARTSDGTETYIATGGIQIVVDDPKMGLVDITSKEAVIWTRSSLGGGLDLGTSTQSVDDPLEVYLEGDVDLRRDEREFAGEDDQVRYQARRFYADLKTERFLALDAELEQYAPGFLTPLRTMADSIAQYREVVRGPDGQPTLGLPTIQARNAVSTGSPFANPGYRFTSSVVDMFKLAPDERRGPFRRRFLNPVDEPTESDVFLIDARNNTFFLGPVPFFYWPRFLTTTEDINPPLQQISLRANNLFGQMILTDWDGFRLLGLRQPKWVDSWNIDIDYLSDRGPALGSEFGYFGDDLSTELFGTDLFPNIDTNYFGYLDLWGIYDRGIDNLGGGPAIVTNGPPLFVAFRNGVPPFQDFRGRVLYRHMQSFLAKDADPLDDFRVQLEAAYISDRHFLEQYFKRLFDSGLDQRTRIYGIRQWRNQAITATAEAMPLDWFTQSQWYPKVEYFRLGDAPLGLGRFFTYYQRTGVSYANTHTASEVNNPGIFFGFLPFDPSSSTSGPFRTGRLYTNHQIDLPLQFQAVRVTPYVQGQLIGWDNQYTNPLPALGYDPALTAQDYIRGPQGSMLGRAWGAYGARADLSFYRAFSDVENDLFNLHGLMHKVVLYADYRNAYSTLGLNRIGVQEELDDNTYELVRRYFALNEYGTGVLPAQYNPLLLTLRRTSSPITGSVDVQDSIQTVRLGTLQRLQTKRGPIDDRRIIDFMTLDLSTYYYPEAQRDNFGLPFGQTQYQYEWFLGDRTSIVSSGWFDYFDIVGDPRSPNNNTDGISVVTAGVNISRPPRGTMFVAYSILNTGPINTSALNTSFGYWMSPKWYGTFGGLYDFGEGMLLSTTFSLTRIGADFLTTVGFNYTPLQDNYSFVFEMVPRFSPRTRIGSASGVPFRPDLRFAPIQ